MHKNRFLTFLFSIVPGCGHMYLGYMKRGVEFMIMFAASAYISFSLMNGFRSLSLQSIAVLFMVVLPIIWFYQMFDSMHAISQLRGLEITIPEDDGFFIPGFTNWQNMEAYDVMKNRKAVKTLAAVLLGVGIYALLATLSNGIYEGIFEETYRNMQYRRIYEIIRNYTPPAIISLLLIFGGIRLLVGGKSGKSENE